MTVNAGSSSLIGKKLIYSHCSKEWTYWQNCGLISYYIDWNSLGCWIGSCTSSCLHNNLSDWKKKKEQWKMEVRYSEGKINNFWRRTEGRVRSSKDSTVGWIKCKSETITVTAGTLGSLPFWGLSRCRCLGSRARRGWRGSRLHSPGGTRPPAAAEGTGRPPQSRGWRRGSVLTYTETKGHKKPKWRASDIMYCYHSRVIISLLYTQRAVLLM